MQRIAVIGSGISGLVAAHGLRDLARVSLFEAGAYFGGHVNTVDLRLDGQRFGVDTGFLVFNERTYPGLIALFAELGVRTVSTDMSFSVRVPDRGLEWSGRNLASVFAQRRNLFRPSFHRMLAEVLRFNRLATAMAVSDEAEASRQGIGEFLARHGFGDAFRDWYFLPMIGCIWSCPTEQMLRFPVATMLRFCHNHGLLQVEDRPRWFTVAGGARQYVEKMIRHVPDARLRTPVRSVRRLVSGQVRVQTDATDELFDQVVMCCHSDQSLALLADATPRERELLGAIRYHRNRAVLHTDVSVLPKRRRAWAAWNYERAAEASREQASVCLHYLINQLQPLPVASPVIVSLNPVSPLRAEHVHAGFDYAHPVFDQAAIDAQAGLPSLQGVGQVWFAGAWTRYGFHEDGLQSARGVLEALRPRLSAAVAA